MPNVAELAKMYGVKNDELQLPMDTQIGMINKLDVPTFRQKILEAETGLNGNLPLLVFDNHDNPRMDVRYGDGVHDEDIQRVLSTILFTTRGAALMYYGDEIGMKTTPPTRKEDVKDPVGVTGGRMPRAAMASVRRCNGTTQQTPDSLLASRGFLSLIATRL